MSDYIPQYPIYINQHLDIICLQGSFSFESGEVNHICGPHSLTVIVKDSFCKFTSFSEDLKIAVLTSDTNDFQMGVSTLGSLVLFQHYVKESPNFPLTKDEMDYVMGVYNTIIRLPSINDCQYCKTGTKKTKTFQFGSEMGYVNTERLL